MKDLQRATPAAGGCTETPGSLLAALSFALDITGGQPEGHAARTCLIALRLAETIYLTPEQKQGLFYAALLKDLGCSSNASAICALLSADDRAAKEDYTVTDWSSRTGSLGYILRNAATGLSAWRRLKACVALATDGPSAARELVRIRANRGAQLARELNVPELAAPAIAGLDEHWNGSGFPGALEGEQIPLLSRLIGLAQTLEIFVRKFGLAAGFEMTAMRCGTWFDPELVGRLEGVKKDHSFWTNVYGRDVLYHVAAKVPVTPALLLDEDFLDRVATVCGQVVDAKSPWTHRHSAGVAEVATGIARVMGFSAGEVNRLRRAALLHDIGKLAVSNLILDKRGPLDAEEMREVQRHPKMTLHLLSRTEAFRPIAHIAASHHERLDGQGYCFGLTAGQLGTEARILAVADMFEALAAKRPYRQDLTDEEVMMTLLRQTGTGLCPRVVEGLQAFLASSHFEPVKLAA